MLRIAFGLGGNSQSYWTKRRKADQIVKSWHVEESDNPPIVDKHQISISLEQSADNYLDFHNESVSTSKQQFSLESYNEVIKTNDISAANETWKSQCLVKRGNEYDETCCWPNYGESYCDEANCLFSDDEESCCSIDGEFDLSDKLAEWALENKVTATTVDKLLKVLHSYHPSLPVTCRTLLKTDLIVPELKKVGSGEYMHYGIE